MCHSPLNDTLSTYPDTVCGRSLSKLDLIIVLLTCARRLNPRRSLEISLWSHQDCRDILLGMGLVDFVNESIEFIPASSCFIMRPWPRYMSKFPNTVTLGRRQTQLWICFVQFLHCVFLVDQMGIFRSWSLFQRSAKEKGIRGWFTG